jgi:nucleotide-binding universal stress UspA family protein
MTKFDLLSAHLFAQAGITDGASVLVAVDGRQSGWAALEWAAAEAAARQCALRIVHAINWPYVTSDGGAFLHQWDSAACEAAELVVNEGARRARAVDPALEISTLVRAGSIGAAVVREGRRDALIVLGRRRNAGRLSRFSWFGRSVGRHVSRRADCPVAIIDLVDETELGPSAGRVVVVVDSMSEPTGALVFAFRSASRRDVGLTVLQRRSLRPVGLDPHVCEWSDESVDCRSVKNVLDACRKEFPRVEVRQHLIGPGGTALVARSRGAALVVLGSRMYGYRSGAFRQSVGHTALESFRSPVALVKTSPVRARA